MKTQIKTDIDINNGKISRVFWFISVLIFLSFFLAGAAFSAVPGSSISGVLKDTSAMSVTIQQQLDGHKNDLHYPGTVRRFYRQSGYRLAWIFPDTVKTHAWEAMLMLDCVLQFGLSHGDYHPQKLLSEKLHGLIEQYGSVHKNDMAEFDILLTDAMITFINNLHYGKLNPEYPAHRIDAGGIKNFQSDAVLAAAINGQDFMSGFIKAQPQSKDYINLQDQMRLMTGQYVGDCYEVPEGQIRKVAINMERLRWIESDDKTYIRINIPSQTLNFYKADIVYRFKVNLGKITHPIQDFGGSLNCFTTTGGSAAINSDHYHNPLGKIVFHLPNVKDFYLYSDPGKLLSLTQSVTNRNNCVEIAEAEKFAELLLTNDHQTPNIAGFRKAIRTLQKKSFGLKNPIPVKITYITTEAKDGVVVNYTDSYNLDQSLEVALYHIKQI